MSNILRLGHRLDRSEIYGPGIRSVFWTQGCTLACKGCWNTQYWPNRGGEEISVSTILSQLEELKDIEGITLLGGEPLQQPQACLELIQGCKEIGLSVFIYTGYEPSEFDEVMQSCFDLCDIAVTEGMSKNCETLRLDGEVQLTSKYISFRICTMIHCCKNKLKLNVTFYLVVKSVWLVMLNQNYPTF